MDPSQAVHRQILEHIEQLPPMPQTVAEVMKMSRSEDYSAAELADVVCRDPTLAARVLRLCNSGFYALSQDVTSIQKAVLLLGFEMVKNLVFSSFVHCVIQGDFSGYAQSAPSLWEHSFGVATACLVVSDRAAPELSDSAYTAGLIHDIGKVVLSTFVSERFDQVVALVRDRKRPFQDAEREVLGTTHAEVGALVAERWKLAPSLRDVILHHHSPDKVTVEPRLGAVVSVGDGICGILGVGAALDSTDCSLDPWSLDLLDLKGERLQRTLDEATQRVLDLKGADIFSS